MSYRTSNFSLSILRPQSSLPITKRCKNQCNFWPKFSRYTNKDQFKFCRHCNKAVPISEIKNARCMCCGYQVKHTTRDGRKY